MIDEDFWDIPESWDLRKFGDIVKATSGKAFESERFTETNSEGKTPVIRIRDIHNNTTEAYTDEEFKEKFSVNPGDLLVGMDGDFEASFWNGPEAALNQRVLKIDSVDGTSLDILKYWLDIVLPEIHRRVPKATVKHLSARKHLRPSYIPVPPEEDQEKVINRIEEQLNSLDKLSSSVNDIDGFASEYNESLLTFLFAGKQNMSSDPPERISTKQDIPGHWELEEISDVSVDMNTGRTPRRSDEENWGGDVKWAKAGEISSAQKYIFDTEERVTEEASINTYGEDYVFITIIGGNLGSVVLPKNQMGINQQNVSIKLREDVNREYFYFYIQSITDYLQDLGRGGAQQAINQTILGNVRIPVPPLDEQEKIVSKIEELDLNRVNRSVSDVQELFEEYRQSILSHLLRQSSTHDQGETNERPFVSTKT